MNERQLDNRIGEDAARIKKDFGALVEDGAARVGRFGENVNQAGVKAKEDLSIWVKDSVSDARDGFNKLTDDTKKKLVGAAETVRDGVGHGLSQYNAKAQEVADRVPGGFGEKVARYPWVAISLTLVAGILLGGLLKPARKMIG